MEPRKFEVQIKGVDRILFARDLRLDDEQPPEPTKAEKEDLVAYGLKYYKRRAHFHTDGFAIIPSVCFRQALTDSQTRNKNPIAIGTIKDMRAIFTSGIRFDNPLYLLKNNQKATADDFEPLKTLLGQKGKTNIAVRPVLSNWSCNITGVLIDDFINESNFTKAWQWIGLYNGLGTWSVRAGGIYGVFTVAKVKIDT